MTATLAGINDLVIKLFFGQHADSAQVAHNKIRM